MTKIKKSTIILIGFIILFILNIIFAFVLPYFDSTSSSNDLDTEKIVYSEAYTESLREEIIKELYGSREQYAIDHTGSRADYIDKQASSGGELVIDEDRMQAVYDSKLREFDEMIDNEKIDRLVKQRQEELIANNTYKDFYKSSEDTTREVMYWKHGGKYFAMLELVFMILYIIYIKRK